MKRNLPTLITAGVLVLVFVLLLFAFQVRQNEVAVITNFGRYSRTIEDPGLYARLPWPVQKIYKFDNRIRTFERKLEQTSTQDGKNLLVTVFVGWSIDDPKLFLERFQGGNIIKAEASLENLIRDTKSSVIGTHPFTDLISPNQEDLKFDEIEGQMLAKIGPLAKQEYGIKLNLLGIKQLGLPESITESVFERMREERMRLIKKFTSEGEAKATEIRAEADRQRQQILADAEAKATLIAGQGEAEAAKAYALLEKDPELAVFLLKLRTLEQALKNKTTLVLDQQTSPLDMLGEAAAPGPAPEKKGGSNRK